MGFLVYGWYNSGSGSAIAKGSEASLGTKDRIKLYRNGDSDLNIFIKLVEKSLSSIKLVKLRFWGYGFYDLPYG